MAATAVAPKVARAAEGGAPTSGSPDAAVVSLEAVLAHAETHAPMLLVANRRRDLAGIAREDADRSLREDPTLNLGLGPRFDGVSAADFDFVVGLGQPIEIAGEGGLRREVASRESDRREADTRLIHRRLRRSITLAYYEAVLAAQHLNVAERSVRFAEEMLLVATKRLAAGDSTRVDLRLAETDLAEARQDQLVHQMGLRRGELRLAELSGWSLEVPPQVPAQLPPPESIPSLDEVLKAAARHNPELRAGQAAAAEAQARVELADREAWPSPTLGLQLAREGSAGSPANYIMLGTLGLELPVWQRNQTERARRRVDEDVARTEAELTERSVRARIMRSHAELESAALRVALFTKELGPSLEDSLDLLRRGFEAGELDLSKVVLARERFLAAQRDALFAFADYYRARASLEFAIGGLE